MATAADRAAAAHQASWCHLHGLWRRGWLELRPGFMASFCALPGPAFNGVTVYGPFAAGELATQLRRLDESGFPYSLQARPGVHAEIAPIARGLGLEPRDPVPLMLCDGPPAAAGAAGLRIRTLAPEENAVHAAILAEAFTAPLELSVELTPPAMLASPNTWTLVGVLPERGACGGQPVTTAFVDLHGGVGQVHNVGTRAAFRGRGFGAAITATATRLAFDAGADLVMLLSSPMGLGVYASIGFRPVEHWSVWESPDD